MKYELAEQLKEAGYPQEDGLSYPEQSRFYSKEGKHSFGYEVMDDEECCYIPTLSELIEACGDNFESITHSHGKSFAYGYSKNADLDGQTDISSGECKDDKEAVAKLYIKLNKKNETK